MQNSLVYLDNVSARVVPDRDSCRESRQRERPRNSDEARI